MLLRSDVNVYRNDYSLYVLIHPGYFVFVCNTIGGALTTLSLYPRERQANPNENKNKLKSL